MIQIAVEFEKFPWFSEGKRPVHVKGTAICQLVKMTEPSSFGDPCHVTWIIKRVECSIGDDTKAMIDFNGNAGELDDFRRWLAGRQGHQISRDLRALAQKEAAEAEASNEEVT